MEIIKVRIYSHPEFDSKLVVEAKADGSDRAVAEGYLGDYADKTLFMVEEGAATRNILDLLGDFDG